MAESAKRICPFHALQKIFSEIEEKTHICKNILNLKIRFRKKTNILCRFLRNCSFNLISSFPNENQNLVLNVFCHKQTFRFNHNQILSDCPLLLLTFHKYSSYYKLFSEPNLFSHPLADTGEKPRPKDTAAVFILKIGGSKPNFQNLVRLKLFCIFCCKSAMVLHLLNNAMYVNLKT